MPQVTLYLPDDIQIKMRKAAEATGLSQSKWVTQVITEKLDNTWPQEFLDLAGAWPDAPTAQELRAGLGEDVAREDF